MAVREFLTFFDLDPRGYIDPNTKWLKRHRFTQGRAFCSKNRYFSYPWSPRP